MVNLHLRYGQQGKTEAAIQVEHLTDEVAKTQQCGYSVRVCVEQLPAKRTGKPHLRENLCRTLSRLFLVNGLVKT